MTTTLYATFSDSGVGERAAGALLDYGAKPEHLSLIRQPDPDREPLDPAMRHPGDWAADVELESNVKSGITPTTAGDAEAGAIKGAGIGLGVGAIAAVASLFVPGVGLVAGGGALAIALAGFAGTLGAGAVAGAVTGYLKDQGMDSHLAERLGAAVSGGGALLSITVPSGAVDESTARSVLEKYEADRVTNLAEAGWGAYFA